MRSMVGAAAAVVLLFLIVACGGQGESTPLPANLAPSATAVAEAGQPTASALPVETPMPQLSPTSQPSAGLVPTLPPPTAAQTPTTLPGSAPSGQILVTIEAIEFEMEGLRGLEESAPMTRTLMTREELSRYLDQQFEDDYSPEEVAVDTRVLAAFDFVSPDIDLRQVLLDLYSSQVLGMYDRDVDTLFVVNDDEFDLVDRLTLAHEYVHGLQDQTFDLDTFVDEDRLDDDQFLSRTALIEGDATLAMTEYLVVHMNELSQAEIASFLEEDPEAQAALEAAPAIIRETLNFPYTYGTTFVQTLQEGGWQAVDEAYADPPQSTEQILHPDKYLDRDEPQLVNLPPLTDTLGSGWARIDSETLGEFQTNLYLAQQVDQETAEQAGAGWDGDSYALYGRGDDDLLLLVTAWDGEADAEEFVAAYRQYATGKYGQDPDRQEAGVVWWQAPGQVAALARQADRTFVVIGPDVATVERVLAALAL